MGTPSTNLTYFRSLPGHSMIMTIRRYVFSQATLLSNLYDIIFPGRLEWLFPHCHESFRTQQGLSMWLSPDRIWNIIVLPIHYKPRWINKNILYVGPRTMKNYTKRHSIYLYKVKNKMIEKGRTWLEIIHMHVWKYNNGTPHVATALYQSNSGVHHQKPPKSTLYSNNNTVSITSLISIKNKTKSHFRLIYHFLTQMLCKKSVSWEHISPLLTLEFLQSCAKISIHASKKYMYFVRIWYAWVCWWID